MQDSNLNTRIEKGTKSALLGLFVNLGLSIVKILSGIIGNSYALIADGIESIADIFSSIIVWRGLKVSGRAADDDYHFGYGKAESLATVIVALMLLVAAIAIAIVGIREIMTPHHTPKPFTLGILAVVILIKETLFRKVFQVGDQVKSSAVKSDAWHHRSDAITSAAAFIGISIALYGGPGWESADDYAALLAALVIAINGWSLLKPAIADLMDKAPEKEFIEQIRSATNNVEGVKFVEKVLARKVGLGYLVDMHVQAQGTMSLKDSHILSGKVKTAVKTAIPEVIGVLIHMEPFEN